MPRQGPESGIPCPNCGVGRLLDVLDTDPQPDRKQVVRIRRCDSCWGTNTTREVLFGTFRPGTKPIDTVNHDDDCVKSTDLPGQMTLDGLLFAESENELAGVVECHATES
jgi:hypothetical protein